MEFHELKYFISGKIEECMGVILKKFTFQSDLIKTLKYAPEALASHKIRAETNVKTSKKEFRPDDLEWCLSHLSK